MIRGLGPLLRRCCCWRCSCHRRRSAAARQCLNLLVHRRNRDRLLVRARRSSASSAAACSCAASSSATSPAKVRSAPRRAKKWSASSARADGRRRVPARAHRQTRRCHRAARATGCAITMRNTCRTRCVLRRRAGAALGKSAGAQHHRQHADSPPDALRPAGRRAGGVRNPAHEHAELHHGFGAPTCARSPNIAESHGPRRRSPQSMRLETPVFHPQK